MYGVSGTTLDEVFLMVARGESPNRESIASCKQNELPINSNTTAQRSYRNEIQMSENALFIVYTRNLFAKRAINFKRDKKAWICSTILPSVFALLGFILVTQISDVAVMPPLELKLSDYNKGIANEPKNPIPFGTSKEFICQPATCISPSTYPTSNIPCGKATYLPNATYCGGTQLPEDVIESFVDDGTLIEQNVSSISDVSLSVTIPLLILKTMTI